MLEQGFIAPIAHLDYGENSYVEFSPPSLPILSHHHIMEQLNGC